MKSNSPVTIKCNDYSNYPKKLRDFLNKALEINQKEYKSFTREDFPEITKENFRQRLKRTRAEIEIVTTGHPTFYKIKGVKLPGQQHSVTVKPMRVGSELLQILESLKEQPPMIHDIKLKFQSMIHHELKMKGATIDSFNHSIKISDIPISDKNMVIKALVYPKIVQIDIACTYKPIIFDFKSLLEFHEILKEASMYLEGLSGVVLPRVNEWIITHYHFNKDGKISVNGRKYHFTVEDVCGGLIRLYLKKMQNGKDVDRLEQIRTPRIPVGELMVEALDYGT